MKKIAAAVLAASMLISMAGCTGKSTDSSSETNSETTSTVESTTESAADVSSEAADVSSEEASSTADDGEMTKEKYDAMTAEDLLANIKDVTNVTTEEYTDLIMTYRFVDIEDEESETYRMALADNITDDAIAQLEYDAKPELSSYINTLLDSEYPQIRGYGFSMMNSLFGVSDDNIALAKEKLEKEENDYVLYCAMNALSNELANDPFIVDFAKKMAADENPKLRYRAALAFANSWSKSVDGAVDQVITLMHDENDDVKGVACQYSGKLADEKVIDPLVEILNDNNTDPSIKGKCIDGLCYLWYDYPFHENTSEKAYKATMDYYKKTPRTDDQPYWMSVGELRYKAESSFDEWKAKATYFNPDELYDVMVEIVKDKDANWLGRTSAVEVIKSQCSEQQFKDLKAIVDGLTDDHASFIQDSYTKAAESDTE